MGRMILDGELRRWEAYATTGEYGFPDHARVVYRCVSDTGVRARTWRLEGDKSDAEATVRDSSDEELREIEGVRAGLTGIPVGVLSMRPPPRTPG